MTASPAPATSRSSPSILLRGIGRIIGLAKSIGVDRIVGLEVLLAILGYCANELDEIVGEDAAELAADVGILIGIEIGYELRLLLPLPIGEFIEFMLSRR